MFDFLPAGERLTLELREVYEKYGYKKYRMDQFEPYDMYIEHKSFLKYKGIITFNSPSGRLLALRPDVTMSIIKNLPDEESRQRVYYNENVFRTLPGSGEFGEINQLGLEYIGGEGAPATAEVVSLALGSLEKINRDYVLSLSHMGFLDALLDEAGARGALRSEIIEQIKQKNSHGLAELLKKEGIAGSGADALTELIGITGSAERAMERLNALAVSEAARSAAAELGALLDSISAEARGRISIDFSSVNDPDYYNGIVFSGYVPNTPRAVLTGGRYDNLMRRFGKKQNAVGFALYMGELERALAGEGVKDA